MAKHLKDKKIVIYKSVEGKDADGFPVSGYMRVHKTPTLWAYFKQLSGSLFYASATTNNKEECLFYINWLDLDRKRPQDYKIEYRGLVYELTRIDPYEGYKRDLALYCKLTTDKLGTIVPYDPTKLPTLTDYTTAEFLTSVDHKKL